MGERLATLLLALSLLGVAASQNVQQQICTQKDCKGKCQSGPSCAQMCSVDDCRMNYNCVGRCSLMCLKGGCPEMICVNEEKSGTCNIACNNGNCKNMKATAGLNSTLACPAGSCDMECSNYASTCAAVCMKGNCNLKCKAKSCLVMCQGGNCQVTAGVGTKMVRIMSGSNSKVTCATGNQCGKAGCDANKNCVSYVENPFNEIPTPKSKPKDTKKPSNGTVPKQKPVGAAESVHTSVLMMVITGICIAISH